MTHVVGETYEIPLQDGESVHGKAVTVTEDEFGEFVRYDILEYGGVLEDGSPNPDERYISQEYYYPKALDISGIEKNTEMPLEYADKSYYEDFMWAMYQTDVTEPRQIVEEYNAIVNR